MSFTNLQIAVDSLPRFADVEFHELDPSYPRVLLGVALAFQIPIFIGLMVLLFAVLVPKAGLPSLAAGLLFILILLLFVFLAWFTHRSARVMRYAVRQHDVVVRSGVFWKQETVQPIRRIQHVEQHQGPVDKRFGLYELKLFSAGTGHFTFPSTFPTSIGPRGFQWVRIWLRNCFVRSFSGALKNASGVFCSTIRPSSMNAI